MKKHEIDPVSGLFGVVFSALGIGFLVGNVDWASVRPIGLAAAVVALVGVAILATAVRSAMTGDQ